MFVKKLEFCHYLHKNYCLKIFRDIEDYNTMANEENVVKKDETNVYRQILVC